MARQAKWPTARVGEIAARAIALATELRGQLEPRLAAGLLDGLVADSEVFGVKRSAAARGAGEVVSATRNQNSIAESALALVVAGRAAVTRGGASKSVQKAFGVGNAVRKTSVPAVLAGLDALIEGASRYPEDARRGGLLSSDLDKARSLRSSLATADAQQEGKKETRKGVTADRVTAQRRVEAAVDAIVGAGLVAFHDQPSVAARFAAIVPGKAAKKSTAPAKPTAT